MHSLAKVAKEDEAEQDKARDTLKKIDRVILGSEKEKIIIEDPIGSSLIMSDKAVKEFVKGKNQLNKSLTIDFSISGIFNFFVSS